MKSKLVPLIEAIRNKPKPGNSFLFLKLYINQIDMSFLEQKFDIKVQTEFNHKLSKKLGFDTVIFKTFLVSHILGKWKT